MIRDIRTVIWKELSESRAKTVLLVSPRMALLLRTFLAAVIVTLGALGGRAMIEFPLGAAITFIPIVACIASVCESFAGEKERHTLETLLASRLPDEAILLGKIFANVLFCWSLSVALLFLVLVGVNIRLWREAPIVFGLPTWIAACGVTFLVMVFVCGLGVLFSLRSSTVEQATTKLMLSFFGVLIPLVISSALLPPGMRDEAQELLSTTRGQLEVVLSQFAFFAVADVLLLAAAMTMFKRGRIISKL